MYLGITTGDVERYKGSGKLWLRHINKYGSDNIDTIWYMLFLDRESLSEFAHSQSKIMDVVESASFANLKHELGIDGGSSGHTDSTKNKMSLSRKGVKHSKSHRDAINRVKKDNPDLSSNQFKKARALGENLPVISQETRQKISISKIGTVHAPETRDKISNKAKEMWLNVENTKCPHCSKVGRGPNMKRYHFENCKSKTT